MVEIAPDFTANKFNLVRRDDVATPCRCRTKGSQPTCLAVLTNEVFSSAA